MNKLIKTLILIQLLYSTTYIYCQETSNDIFEKQLADNAFNEKRYDKALEYYRNYLKLSNSKITNLQVSKKILNILLIQENVKQVARDLAKLKGGFSPLEVQFYNAEIYRIQKQYDKAIPLYKSAIKTSDIDLKEKSLAKLALVYMFKNNWKQAIIYYSVLDNISKKFQYKAFATRQTINAMIREDSINDAFEELKNMGSDIRKEYQSDFDIFNVIILLKMNKLVEAEKEYNKLLIQFKPSVSQLFSWCSELYADIISTQNEINKSDVKKIATLYKQSIISTKDDTEKQRINYKLINIYLKNNQTEAIKEITAFIQLYPNNNEKTFWIMQLGRLYAENNNPELAIKTYNSIIEETRDIKLKVGISKELGDLYAVVNDFIKAEKAFTYILNNSETNIDKDFARFSLGKLFFKQKDYKTSLKHFNGMGDSNLSLKEQAIFNTMVGQIKLEDYDNAITTSNIYLNKFSKGKLTNKILFKKAETLLKVNKKIDAINIFNNFIKQFPNDPNIPIARFYTGQIHFDLKNFEKAIENLSTFSEKFPEHKWTPNALYIITHSYFILKDKKATETGEKLCKRYIKSKYGKDMAFWLVEYYTDNEKVQKAKDILDNILITYKDDSEIKALALFHKGYILLKEKEVDKVLEIIKRIEKEYEKTQIYSETLFLKGNILSNKGEYSKALIAYQEALKQNKITANKVKYLGRIGDSLYSIGAKENDESLLDKAIDNYKSILKNQNIGRDLKNITNYKLGLTYEKNKNIEAALNLYERVIDSSNLLIKNKINIQPDPYERSLKAIINIYLTNKKLVNKQNLKSYYNKLKLFDKNIAEAYKEAVLEALK